MVHEDTLDKVRMLAAKRDDRIAALRTARDAAAYRDDVRRKIRRCFGPRPAKTPLNAVQTGRLERDGYDVEKIIFESRPGYPVTANLYLPHKRAPQAGFPAVLGTCGHSENGKAAVPYQAFARSLACMGYVCLIYDPVGQGERHQYAGHKGEFAPGGCCAEHNMSGKQMGLLGEFFGMWRTWDGIRALDYLLTRPEIDRSRVGVTGNSGGGTLTCYLNALDDRFTMAAPSCFVTTYLANIENELPADSEQYPPGIIGEGLDIGDFLIAQAPRPTIVLGQAQDFFDRRGLEKSFEQIKRVYMLLGAASEAELYIGPDPHGYHLANRQAMYRFFNRHTGVKGSGTEPVRPNEPDEHLFAAPKGTVAGLRGQKLIFDITASQARDVASTRRTLPAAKLPAAIRRVLNLTSRPRVPHYRALRPYGVDDESPKGAAKSRFTRDWRFGVQTEQDNPRVVSVLHAWIAGTTDTRYHGELPVDQDQLLYVPHVASHLDVPAEHCPVKPGKGRTLLSVDVRGIGESWAQTCGGNSENFFAAYGSDYMYSGHGRMLGQCYLGRRVHDLLAVLDLLEDRGAKRVHLAGRGLGAIIATFAACLHPLVKQVTLRHGLRSFHELTQTPIVGWPQSVMPWNVLNHFDLPDCYRLLAGKKLKMISPWDAVMQ